MAIKALRAALPDERDTEPLVLWSLVGKLPLKMVLCFASVRLLGSEIVSINFQCFRNPVVGHQIFTRNSCCKCPSIMSQSIIYLIW